MKISHPHFRGGTACPQAADLPANESKRVGDNALRLATRSSAELRRASRRLLRGGATLLLTSVTAAFAAEQTPPAVKSFVSANCVDCHDESIEKGGFDITKLPFGLDKPDAFSRWVHVLDRVQAGEMPPKDEPRPPADALLAFTHELAGRLREADASRIAREGRVRARRLTRFEYERTMHDLLGIDVPLVNLLPEDARADGFDTVSSAQGVSHHLLEKYLGAIDVALDAAFGRALETPDDQITNLAWAQLQELRPRGREPGPRMEHQDAIAWASGIAFHGRMPPTMARDSGWYRVTLRVAAVNPPADGQVWCSVRSGVCFAIAPTLFWIGSFAAIAEEREHTFEAWIEAGHMLEVRPNDSALKRARFGTVVPTAEAERIGIPGVAIRSLRMERIHPGGDIAAVRQRLFGSLKLNPAGSTDVVAPAATRGRKMSAGPRREAAFAPYSAEPAAEAARLVRAFATRAFRREVSELEAAPYVALARAELDSGATLVDALRGAYRGVLASPRFLYLEEATGRLSDDALASRLSYFLWSTAPDQELRSVAEAGKLREPATLRGQVDRMLRDGKAQAFVENFTGQWLNLVEIDFTTPDAKLYPEFDEVLKHAMLEETRAGFAELVRRDLGVTHIVDSDFSLMNNRLARHYGVPWPGGEGLQRIALRPQDHRGGLITHGSVLKVTANGTTTSPVIRGVWMLERIMGQHVPPVPASVPAIEPDIRGAQTIREQLDKHRNVASCAVCHVKIDPPGFALETYDVIGGWRENYRVVKEGGKSFERGPAVDPSFTMADGRPFKDTSEFKKFLLDDPDQLARNLAAKLVTYGTGAPVGFADRTAIEEIVASTRKTGHGVRSLIHAVVLSPLFTHK
jgi:hypothetical protein